MIIVAKYKFPKKSEVSEEILRLIGENTSAIYCLYFSRSAKMYFGQTTNFWDRMRKYRAKFKSGKLKDQPKLYNALKKYGFEFTLFIMKYDVPVEELDDLETSYIAEFDTFKNGYNSTPGGKVLRGKYHPNFGRKHSDESKEKMSQAMSGEKNHMYGKTLSDDHKNKLSQAKSGENHPFFGKTLSDDHKNKIGQANAGANSSSAKPMVAFGKLFACAKYASDHWRSEKSPNTKSNFIKNWPNCEKHSQNVFWVSKEFYDSYEHFEGYITKEMYDSLETA